MKLRKKMDKILNGSLTESDAVVDLSLIHI